jgi:hypothetical protein
MDGGAQAAHHADVEIGGIAIEPILEDSVA